MLEFSFEKQKTTNIPKNLFIQNKIIQFIEINLKNIEEYKLVDNINVIMKEYESKKNKLGVVDKLQDSVILEDLKNLSMSMVSNSKEGVLESSRMLNCSGMTDLQNQSNYNININLVLNDTMNDSEK